MSFSGIVIHGKELGRTIGYPTANIALAPWLVEDGVYVLSVTVRDREYRGVGTYREDITLFEAHIFDFDADIYDETISISLLRKIRDNRKFDSFAELKKQIDRDAEEARR